MKIFKKIIFGLLLLIAIFVFVSFLLPQKQHVERSTEISAPATKIYPYLASPKLFREWSPWSKMDPKMKVQYSGPESGRGAGMSWQSEQSNVGIGSWIITDTVENESLIIEMGFGNKGTANSFFKLTPKDEKTIVTWGFDTDAGMNPIMRWFGLFMDKMVGDEYAKGLVTLKALVE